MNKLKELINLLPFGSDYIAIENWVNQNYVPKPKDKSFYGLVDELVKQKIEQILNLECLKEEFIDRTSDITLLKDGDWMDNPELDRRNQLRSQIKQEITDLISK